MPESDESPGAPKRRWRSALLALGVLLAAGWFVAANRHDVPAAFRAARAADRVWLLTALVASACFACVYGLARRAAMAAFGVEISGREAIRSGAVAHSVNIVSKSGGMAGAVVYREDARRLERSPSRVMGGYVMAVVLGDAAFALTLAAATLLLVVDGRLTRRDLLALAIVSVYFCVIAAMVIAAFRSRASVRALHALPARIRRRAPDHRAADELFEAIARIRARPSRMLLPFAWMLGIEALGVAMMWICLAAYGQHTGLAMPVVAYAISVLFSMVSVLPAGVGFAEASLGAVLISFDVAGPTAAVVVITYRVIETWIPLAIGVALARPWRRAGGTAS